ncbi:hypothetical protein [Flavobacterium turcicum]|uniref:Uncharacterized protein n=1 Tax=Flavobacterium turcicum TaxID=2764718 RepID=A0ABR7JJH5_9FLAO|nr:hypothetical protein [Flavobacterium turcicum]MBC5864635.1 hypothetical protein [Flavobacterium turcicum]NHL03366.1 hypothetical protein [Flavobacterium turcicum]
MITVTEKRIVEQEWYETEYTKTGWESQGGWYFKDTREPMDSSWNIVEHLDSDKFGNPLIAIAEKETELF